jgi:hypothetical protein
MFNIFRRSGLDRRSLRQRIVDFNQELAIEIMQKGGADKISARRLFTLARKHGFKDPLEPGQMEEWIAEHEKNMKRKEG